MCFPGLHLSLGIFNRLWILLEEECTEVDLALAQESAPGGGGGGGGQQQLQQVPHHSEGAARGQTAT